MNHGLGYARYELLRTFRNRRLFIFSLGFPLILYFAIAGPNRHEHSIGGTGIAAPLYFMVGLTAFGTMNAVLGTGARIAAERAVGWNRQLRLTPLSTRTYFRVKVLTAYCGGLHDRAAVRGRRDAGRPSPGRELGEDDRLDPGRPRSVRRARDPPGPPPHNRLGRTCDRRHDGRFALLGGVWFPVTSGVMHTIAEALPSYWLVEASHVGLGGQGWGTTGWLVVAAWTVAAAAIARRAYARDTQRV